MVNSTELSGSYVLGFRVDPEEKLKILYKELTSLHEVYSNNPIYGVEYNWLNNDQIQEQYNSALVDDLDVVEEPRGEITNVLVAYLADGQKLDRPPVYSSELGLAVESLKEGYTLQKLWEVIPQ